jgi:hypothetical protein
MPISIQADNIVLETGIRQDLDLKLVYNPVYFNTIDLVSELGLASSMKGGYFQDTDKLTVPFRYFVYILEKNPLSIGLSYINDKTQAPSKNTDNLNDESPGFFQRMKSIFTFDNKPVEKDQDVVKEEEVEKEEEVVKEEAVKEEVLEEEEEEAVKEEAVKEEEEAVKEEEEAVKEEEEAVKEEVLEEEEEAVKEEEVVKEEPPTSGEKIIISIKLEPEIEYNSKSLKEIASELQQLPRTIEMFPESGLDYLLLEKITFDLYSQKTYLAEHLNMIYSEFREEHIYNINGHYVVFDSEKLTYLGTDNTKITEAIAKNNTDFCNFIQKMRLGGDSILLIPTNNIIENTNVDKLTRRLLATTP